MYAQQLDWPRIIAIATASVATLLNVMSLLEHRAKKKRINGDMALAVEMYCNNPTPETVFAAYLMEKYPDGNCELGQTIRMYEEWKRDKDIPLPLKLLNDGFIVEAITRGVANNPPDES